MSWTVGKYRVEYEPTSIRFGGKLVIDYREKIDFAVDKPIELGRATGRMQVAVDHAEPWIEMWIDGGRVPATPEGTEQKKAPEGAPCAVHDKGGGAYRSQSAPAKYLCGVCGRGACKACIAIDKVLCRECYHAGLAIEQWTREAHRRRRAMKVGIGAALTGAVGIFAGVEWRLLHVALGGAGFALLGGAMGEVNRRRWKQKPHPGHALWAAKPPRLPVR